MDPIADRLRVAARMSSSSAYICQLMEDAANYMDNDMTERETFVAWLENTKPSLPTTHDVEVAWRGWLARSETVCTCDERASVLEPLCPACSDSFEAAAAATP